MGIFFISALVGEHSITVRSSGVLGMEVFLTPCEPISACLLLTLLGIIMFVNLPCQLALVGMVQAGALLMFGSGHTWLLSEAIPL